MRFFKIFFGILGLKILILILIFLLPFEEPLSKFINNYCSKYCSEGNHFKFQMDRDRNFYLRDFVFEADNYVIEWKQAFFSYNLKSLLRFAFENVSLNDLKITLKNKTEKKYYFPLKFDKLLVNNFIYDNISYQSLSLQEGKFSLHKKENIYLNGSYVSDFSIVKIYINNRLSEILNKKDFRIHTYNE